MSTHQVIQRRRDGIQNFYQNWQVYKRGFGGSDGDFWLGNQFIHTLTTGQTYVLRVDLTNGVADAAVAEYNSFSLDTEQAKYTLRLGEYRDIISTAGKSAYDPFTRTKFIELYRTTRRRTMTHKQIMFAFT